MPLILGTNSIKDTGYEVANSVRLDSASTAYLSRTVNLTQNTTSQHKFTISCWFKLGKTGQTNGELFGAFGSNDYFTVRVSNGNAIDILSYDDAIKGRLVTNQLLRDHSAWYHIVVACDSNNGSGTNRMRLYLNGSEVTSFSTDTHPTSGTDLIAENMDTVNIGRNVDQAGGAGLFDGYIAEFVYIDNDQLEPDSFGEFDEDSPFMWKPKAVTGISGLSNTFSFYLDFEDSSNLGNDVSGNNNDFTSNNLTALDQSTDTCTNNFCTLNPLDNYFASSTLAEGNLKITTNASNYSYTRGTFGLSSGKWYFEQKCVTANNNSFGVADDAATSTTNQLEVRANGWSYYAGGHVYNNSSTVISPGTYTDNDILGCYLDLDNNKIYFAKNGTILNSGTGHSLTATSSLSTGLYFPAFGDGGTGSAVMEINFGSPSYSISSGNSDANGYGNFEYDPSSGTFDGSSKNFYAICTKNLAEFG